MLNAIKNGAVYKDDLNNISSPIKCSMNHLESENPDILLQNCLARNEEIQQALAVISLIKSNWYCVPMREPISRLTTQFPVIVECSFLPEKMPIKSYKYLKLLPLLDDSYRFVLV